MKLSIQQDFMRDYWPKSKPHKISEFIFMIQNLMGNKNYLIDKCWYPLSNFKIYFLPLVLHI